MSDFNELRRQKELINLRESVKYSWRDELSEGCDDHPYVDVLPQEKDPNAPEKKEKKSKKAKDEKKEVKEETQRLSLTPNTNFRTEELSVKDQMELMKKHNAANPRKPFDPDARKRQRAAQLKAAAKNAAPDTRTDAEKMSDATGPRKGSNFRGD